MQQAEIMPLLRLVVNAIVDKKGFDVAVLDVSALTSLGDGFVICSAAHDRQVRAVADEIERRLRETGRRPIHVEGERRSEWVLLDYGDLVIHIFTEERRSYYALDTLWGDAPRIPEEQLADE